MLDRPVPSFEVSALVDVLGATVGVTAGRTAWVPLPRMIVGTKSGPAGVVPSRAEVDRVRKEKAPPM